VGSLQLFVRPARPARPAGFPEVSGGAVGGISSGVRSPGAASAAGWFP
jgi:hypothetical protein